MLAFNEMKLNDALCKMPSQLQAAFALSCAQRLSEVVKNCRNRTTVLNIPLDRFDAVLEALWEGATNGSSIGSAIKHSIELLSAEPVSEDALEEAGCPYIEDAISALIYSFNALNGAGERYACWAAMQAYAAIDDFVARTYFSADIVVDSDALLRHELTQRELSRQLRDLGLLQKVAQRRDEWAASCAQLRVLSSSEAGTLFSL